VPQIFNLRDQRGSSIRDNLTPTIPLVAIDGGCWPLPNNHRKRYQSDRPKLERPQRWKNAKRDNSPPIPAGTLHNFADLRAMNEFARVPPRRETARGPAPLFRDRP